MNGWATPLAMDWLPLVLAPLLLVALAWSASEAAGAILNLEPIRLLAWWEVSLALLVVTVAEFRVLARDGGLSASLVDTTDFVKANSGILISLLLLGLAASGAALFGRGVTKGAERRGDPLQARRLTAIGTLGEDRVAWALEKLGWPFLRNVVIARRGWSVEIDAIVRAPNEIVLLEVKTYSGVISGGLAEARWEQWTRLGTRRVYSPVRQSEAHLAAVRTVLGNLPVRMCVLIVSAGNARWEGELQRWVVPIAGLAEALQREVGKSFWGGGRLGTAWDILTTEAEASEKRRGEHLAYVRSRRRAAGWWH